MQGVVACSPFQLPFLNGREHQTGVLAFIASAGTMPLTPDLKPPRSPLVGRQIRCNNPDALGFNGDVCMGGARGPHLTHALFSRSPAKRAPTHCTKSHNELI